MRAVTIDSFGGPEVLSVRDIPRPKLTPEQVLVQVESAGIGIWDVGEREGMIAKASGIVPKFPWTLGSEGAGKVVEVGVNVTDVREGDRVYGSVWATNPKAGFYAEFAALDADRTYKVPSALTTEQAGALFIDGGTALRGLDDALGVKAGEKLMIFGASGGLGHLAVQLGKRLGARVFAVASGEDGVSLALRLGADGAVDGRDGKVMASGREFAPDGFDAALVTVGGEESARALNLMRPGGRVAYPWVNQRAPPNAPPTVSLHGYNGAMDRALIAKLSMLVDSSAFEVHLGKTFTLDQAVDAYQAVRSHHLGRLALLPSK